MTLKTYNTLFADLCIVHSRKTDQLPIQQQMETLTYIPLTSGAAWTLTLTA